MIQDKCGILAGIHMRSHLAIELGVGSTKRVPDAVTVDIADSEFVDLVGDAEEVLSALPSSSVDEISSWHFLEHVGDVPSLLRQMHRVLKPSGTIRIVVPHFSNPFFYSDPTHRSAFGLYTLAYYAKCALFKRSVPSYCKIDGLRLVHVRYGFKSYRPFYLRHLIKKLAQLIVNSSRYTMEFYEENLCWLVPCYEIEYTLTAVQHDPTY